MALSMQRCTLQKPRSLLVLILLAIWACMPEVYSQVTCLFEPDSMFGGNALVQLNWACAGTVGALSTCTSGNAQCNVGPAGAGPAQAECLGDGVWVLRTTAGACPGDCTSPPSAPDVEAYTWPSGCTSGTPRTICTGICAPGYEVPAGKPSAPQIMCSGGSWMRAGSGACVQKAPCTVPPSGVSNAVWSSCQLPFRSGQICTGGCAVGFQASGGTPTATCDTGTTWALGPGRCVPPPCNVAPPEVGNVVWGCRNNLPVPSGQTCTGSCPINFQFADGVPIATCNTGTSWTVGPGRCVPSTCTVAQLQDQVPNVVWSCTNSPALSGESCRGSCAAGFQEFGGTLVATCNSGTWTTSAGRCERNCQTPPGISFAPNTAWSCGSTPSRSQCVGTCIIGPSDEFSGPPRARCSNGEWAYVQGQCPGLAPCTFTPPALPFVSWNCPTNPPIASGQSCRGSCAPGSQEFNGSVSATCNSGGWIVDAGRCEQSCQNPPSSSFLPNATWSCAPTSSRSQCVGTCASEVGPDPISGPPTAVCNNGTWGNATGSCTACLTRLLPTLDSSSNYTWSATCNTSAVVAQGTRCFGDCRPGFNHIDGNRPGTTCTAGIWHTPVGLCTLITAAPQPLNCSGTNLEDLSEAVSWPDNCTASTVAQNAVCTGSCSFGYALAEGASAPRAVCSNGTWQAQVNGCPPQNCTGNPGVDLANIRWSCGDFTPHLGTCNGTCIEDCTAGTQVPVATCEFGNWTVDTGPYKGGGTSRYLAFNADPAVIDLIIDKVNNGEVLENINLQLNAYLGLLQRDFAGSQGSFNLRIANLWIVSGGDDVSRRRRSRRKLAATQTESITVGYQFLSPGVGFLSAAQEAVLDVVATNTRVLSAINSISVGYAIEKGWLPPTYDFSRISYGPSDETGEFIRPPRASVACYMSFDINNTTGLGILDQASTGGAFEQLQADTSSEAASFALCPNVDGISATFPYQATRNIGNPKFTAVALDMTSGAAGRDTSISCTASAGIGNSAALISVTCRKEDGGSFSGGAMHKVMLTATFTCENKQLTSFTAANFRIKEAPSITILQQGAGRPSVCASQSQFTVPFNYTMLADAQEEQADVVAAVSSSDKGLVCRVTLVRGGSSKQGMTRVSIGTATVTCNGKLTAGSNPEISLMLQAVPKVCAPSNFTAKVRVSVTCCQPGSSYARRPNQGTLKAKCWQHFLPGMRPAQCQAPTVVHGIYNQGPAAAKLMYFDKQTNRCAARSSVGTAVLECRQSDPRRLNFRMQSSEVNTQALQMFMVRCEPPKTARKCPGNTRWLKVGQKQHNASIVVTGNTKTTTFSYNLPASESCSCDTAFWSLYEAGTYSGLPKRLCNV